MVGSDAEERQVVVRAVNRACRVEELEQLEDLGKTLAYQFVEQGLEAGRLLLR